MKRAAPLVVPVVLFLAVARPAAGAPPRDAALAAFEEGRSLVKAGDCSAAIARFEESERLKPSVGAELNLGSCYEHEARYASAARMYLAGADRAEAAGESQRAAVARKRAAEVAERASSLRIQLEEPPAAGLQLFVDDEPEDPQAWSAPRPIDRGAHHLRCAAAGRVPWTKDITIAPERERATVVVPPLSPVSPAAAGSMVGPGSSAAAGSALPPGSSTLGSAIPPASSAVGAPAPASRSSDPARAAPPAQDAADPGRALRITGVVVAGLGGVALAVGAYTGLQAMSQWNQREAACQRDLCTPAGYALGDQAKNSATVSTVAFVAGGVALASGLALVILAPRRHAAPVNVGATPFRGGAVLNASGSF